MPQSRCHRIPGPLRLVVHQQRELTVVEVNGAVVALESVNPKGAVRIIGAAMWSGLWIDGNAPGGARITDPATLRDPLVLAT